MEDMGTKTNELLAHRLADMLYRLNQGETLDPKQLAEHYRTSVRTVYRDLTERFAYLPIQKVEHGYRLDTSYLGKLDFQDIKHFAALSGVVGMFPSFDRDFLRQLLDSRASLAYASKGQSFEDASLFKHLFELLKPAIVDRMHISFVYKDKRRHVEPYKLIHHRGCWYLAAVHQGILKAYRLSKVSDVQVRADLPVFTHDQAIVDQLKHEDSIWFGLQKQEVILSVDHSVASYFKARALLPDQQIIKHLNDGGLLVSSQMVNSLQILPLVRYWMPHLKIISPEPLKRELEDGIRTFLGVSSS
jgi:predicted DNA-binding transcriptional regulator YafY